MDKDISIIKKPKGNIPVCHDKVMKWDKYRGEWECQSPLAHWSKIIIKE